MGGNDRIALPPAGVSGVTWVHFLDLCCPLGTRITFPGHLPLRSLHPDKEHSAILLGCPWVGGSHRQKISAVKVVKGEVSEAREGLGVAGDGEAIWGTSLACLAHRHLYYVVSAL